MSFFMFFSQNVKAVINALVATSIKLILLLNSTQPEIHLNFKCVFHKHGHTIVENKTEKINFEYLSTKTQSLYLKELDFCSVNNTYNRIDTKKQILLAGWIIQAFCGKRGSKIKFTYLKQGTKPEYSVTSKANRRGTNLQFRCKNSNQCEYLYKWQRK